jgi:hypothetical protein
LLRGCSRSVVAPILLEIDGLASSFISFVIQFVSRSANTPAHLCAQLACAQGGTSCWMNSIPSFLATSLLADSTAVSE